MDIMGIMAQLQARGHEVLVVASTTDAAFLKEAAARHSSNTSAEAMEVLQVDLAAAAAGSKAQQQHHQARPGAVTHNRFAVPRFPRTLTAGMELELVIQDVVAAPCAAVLQDQAVMQRLRAFGADAVVSIGIPVPVTAPDSCGCLLSHALGVPLLDIDCGMTFWSGPLSVPQFGTGLTPADLATWRGWSLNAAAWAIKGLMQPLLSGLVPNAWSQARASLGLPRPASACLLVNAVNGLRGHGVKKCDVLLNVILGSWLLEHPRPLGPHQVLVGPGTPRAAQAISDPEVAAFVEGATSGLVLVGVGTSYQFNRWLAPEDYKELAAAFADLGPVRVLWHLKTQVLPKDVVVEDLNLGTNTLIVPWVEYNDVLGHPNARLFMSHCGLHSVYEAAYHGVPLIGMPFMFEQAESGAKLAATGAAVVSPQAPAFRTGGAAAAAGAHYTRDHVAGLAREVMSDPQYAAAARALSLALKTQAKRRHPYEAAADEIELAIYTRRVAQVQQVQQHQEGHDTGRHGEEL